MFTKEKLLPLVIIIFLFSLAFSPYHAIERANLKADDASYLAHGFTLGLDFNLAYNDNVADWKTRDQKIAAHPIGPGLLAAPFIAIFSIIDKLTGHEVIEDHNAYQYSWSYFGFIFSSVFYFIAGLFLYRNALDKLFSRIAAWHFLLMASSFGILYYVLFRPVMGHSFEFFSLALCFWGSVQVFLIQSDQNKEKIKPIFWTTLGVVLTLQIRPANINVILLPFIIWTALYSIHHIFKEIKVSRKIILLYFGLLFLNYLPFAVLNMSLYNEVYPSFLSLYGTTNGPIPAISNMTDAIQVITTLFFRIPNLLIIFFSSEFGIAFCSSILFFGTGFFIFYILKMYKYNKILSLAIFVLTAMYVGLPISVILFWQTVGDAYGYRFLFCLFPLAILGYGFWHEAIKNKFQKIAHIFIMTLCMFSLTANMFFGLNQDLMYKSEHKSSFGQEGGNAQGYNIEVIKYAAKPSSWATLLAIRTPGYILIGALEELGIDINKLHLPSYLSEKVDKLNDIRERPPISIYYQILLLTIVFVGSYAVLIRKKQ